jgi:prolipoprotein diacylglyceryl transferase
VTAVSAVSAIPVGLPSPTQGVWNVGPLPLRAYALCILAGIVVAIWVGDRRWRARGGRAGTILDIAAWAVPFGIVGGRLYHVITSWQPYFGPGGHPVQALYIWEGGLGIWGAISLGGVGAYIGARRAGILMPPLADALAPGIVLAQAIGRWGNWFNNELYGAPTNLPWGLQIHRWDQAAGHAVVGPDGKPVVLGTFQPTFLYESLWDAGTAAVLILLDRRFRIGHGRLFALYVLIYTLGRGWIEALRVDPANHVLGLRLNIWTSILVGLGALIYIIVSARRHPGREGSVYRDGYRDGDRDGDRGGDPDRDELPDGEDGVRDEAATARWLAWVRTRPSRGKDGTDEPEQAGDGGDESEPDAGDADDPRPVRRALDDEEQNTGYQPKHAAGDGRWRVGDGEDGRERTADAPSGSATS